MVVNPSIEIYLLDPAGKILAFSAPPGKVKLDRVDLVPIKKWFEDDIVYPLTGDDPRNPARKKVFSAARIPEQGQLQAYLYIILGGEIFDSIAQKLRGSYIMQLSAWWIMASLLFALITGLLLFAYLTRRLKRLAAANLKQADTMRRELVANVSHDLRTPLATLQGYIETLLLKNERLSDKDRKRHLEIAIRHCQRLSNLVDELFELAKLDSREIQVQCEPFNISELAHDVVQKFNLTAEKRQITIQIDHDQQLPFANADIAMIERVIENLLDNALRHTSAGGSIRLSFSTQNGDISVCVRDTGSGISEEDLPHIFDRFYHRDRTQEGKAGYSGLGLAITKRILELHGKTILVESKAGSGTAFTFFLPVDHPA